LKDEIKEGENVKDEIKDGEKEEDEEDSDR